MEETQPAPRRHDNNRSITPPRRYFAPQHEPLRGGKNPPISFTVSSRSSEQAICFPVFFSCKRNIFRDNCCYLGNMKSILPALLIACAAILQAQTAVITSVSNESGSTAI